MELGGKEATDSVFHIPEGYFKAFPEQMTAIIRTMNADTVLSLPVSKSGPYDLPEGYFDHLSGQVLTLARENKAITEDSRHPWADDTRHNPYQVPEDYFTGFAQQLMAKISGEDETVTEEIAHLSPLLAGLQKAQPFALPKGYFNGEAFSRQVQEQQEQNRIVEHPSVRSIKWARWAAAAAVIAIFVLGGLHYLVPGTPMTEKASFQKALAQIPEQSIREWLSNNMDEFDVNSLGGSVSNIKTVSSPSLNGISEQEIRDYLENEVW